MTHRSLRPASFGNVSRPPPYSIDPLGNIVFAAAFEGTVDIDGTLLTNTNTSIDLMLVSFDP